MTVRHALGPHLSAALSIDRFELQLGTLRVSPYLWRPTVHYGDPLRLTTATLEGMWRAGAPRDRVRPFVVLGAGVGRRDPTRTFYDAWMWDEASHQVFTNTDAAIAFGVLAFGVGVEWTHGPTRLIAQVHQRVTGGGDAVLQDASIGFGLDTGARAARGEPESTWHRPYWQVHGGPATQLVGHDPYQDGFDAGVSGHYPLHPRWTVGVGLEQSRFQFDRAHWTPPVVGVTTSFVHADPLVLTSARVDVMLYTNSPPARWRPFVSTGLALARRSQTRIEYQTYDPLEEFGAPLEAWRVITAPNTRGVVSAGLGLEYSWGRVRASLQVRYRRGGGNDIEIRDASLGVGI